MLMALFLSCSGCRAPESCKSRQAWKVCARKWTVQVMINSSVDDQIAHNDCFYVSFANNSWPVGLSVSFFHMWGKRCIKSEAVYGFSCRVMKIVCFQLKAITGCGCLVGLWAWLHKPRFKTWMKTDLQWYTALLKTILIAWLTKIWIVGNKYDRSSAQWSSLKRCGTRRAVYVFEGNV